MFQRLNCSVQHCNERWTQKVPKRGKNIPWIKNKRHMILKDWNTIIKSINPWVSDVHGHWVLSNNNLNKSLMFCDHYRTSGTKLLLIVIIEFCRYLAAVQADHFEYSIELRKLHLLYSYKHCWLQRMLLVGVSLHEYFSCSLFVFEILSNFLSLDNGSLSSFSLLQLLYFPAHIFLFLSVLLIHFYYIFVIPTLPSLSLYLLSLSSNCCILFYKIYEN